MPELSNAPGAKLTADGSFPPRVKNLRFLAVVADFTAYATFYDLNSNQIGASAAVTISATTATELPYPAEQAAYVVLKFSAEILVTSVDPDTATAVEVDFQANKTRYLQYPATSYGRQFGYVPGGA